MANLFDQATVTLDGQDRFYANVAGMKDGLRQAVLEKAVQAGGEVFLALARDYAPVAAAAKTPRQVTVSFAGEVAASGTKWGGREIGQLRDSLALKVLRSSPDHATAAVGPGPNGFYGRFLEYGTVKMAARPFLRPAFDFGVTPAQAAVEGVLSEFMESFRA